MQVKLFLVSLTSLVVVLSVPPGTKACRCAPAGSPCEEFGPATTVFIGLVLRSEQVKSGLNYSVAPERTFKGSPEDPALFFSCIECTCDWGYEFSVGERYLIYASRMSSGYWHAYACGRTRPLAEADEDLEFIQNLDPEGSGGRLFGAVFGIDSGKRIPLVGARVTAEGLKQSYMTTTDVNGEYDLSGLIPGQYLVSFKYSEGEIAYDGYSRGAYVYDRGCFRLDFLCIRDEANRRYTYK